ncbi:hypothetical protein D0469_14250 [Peribacillus saganii]|uniref:Uncharacterized protein n=1 Tax=Peribacillus saganii TaxID=2303992 RepID=A0A372LMD7_9BACI|nr:hypothetical protein D0469_14250 [Peribacillus saganii]
MDLPLQNLQHSGCLMAPPSIHSESQRQPLQPPYLERGRSFLPSDFTILNIKQRIQDEGDWFKMVTTNNQQQSLNEILAFIKH